MNGIISAYSGLCLAFGFVVGAQSSPFSRSLDYSKINWISNDISSKKIELSKNDSDENSENELNHFELEFKPYQLPLKKSLPSTKRKQLAHFVQIKKIVHQQKIVKVSALALLAQQFEIVAPALKKMVALDFVDAHKKMQKQFFETVYLIPVTNNELFAYHVLEPEPLPVALAPAVKALTKKEEIKEITKPVSTQIMSIQTVKSSEENPPLLSIHAAVEPKLETRPEIRIEEAAPIVQKQVKNQQEEQPEIDNKNLAKEQKTILQEALLNEQLKRYAVNIPTQQNHPIEKPITIVNNPPSNPPENHLAPPVPHNKNKFSPSRKGMKYQCRDLSTHLFEKPGATESSQINPEQKKWISKEIISDVETDCERGWVKFESQGSPYPTIARHPAPNNGTTLLLDQNALALMAIKSGIRIAHGAGIIVGLVPEGFKIEFTGRAEETQYFENNHKKYFAILNVEPGAGVVELISEQKQNLSSTIFTPVFQDTITYLDLSVPEVKNILVQVVKSGKADDKEISGLTVALSTHQGIQAITQSQGQAVLKNVNIVPGFPVFIDVSSKREEQQSFTYRYELKEMNSLGVYVVNQVVEKNIYKWIKQVGQSISDQSGMVIGHIARENLQGFKSSYFAKVNAVTENSGFQPLNYSILWNGKISNQEPLEGDKPRFMAVQVPEGLGQARVLNESHQEIYSSLIPVSPRIINVISE